MLGESTIGTYVAYAGTVLLLLLFVVMFLRLAAMLSLLFLSPVTSLIRRLLGRAPLVEDTTQEHPGSNS